MSVLKGEISISEAFNALTNGPDKIEYLNKGRSNFNWEDYDTGPVVNKTDTGKKTLTTLKEMDSLIGLKAVKRPSKNILHTLRSRN